MATVANLSVELGLLLMAEVKEGVILRVLVSEGGSDITSVGK